ncbi:MAG TPA: prolyl oligopeptidase family serine peptidase [Chitinophagaceae bacterium]|nr:prolyl oligopeptidase family serine peptidase [Chitinophagaceae bacterium]HRX93243.1 prolyl oligopeptidase family serine peptidase [Chitinophagaceae bacterium]
MLFKKFIAFVIVIAFSLTIHSQDNTGYTLPPKDITDMLLAESSPLVSINDKGDWMLMMQRSSYPSVEELAQPELRIAGLRINPANYSRSRQSFMNDIWLKNIGTGKEMKITGLPSPLFAGSISWSPDDKKIALTHTTNNRVDIYVVDVATQKAAKVNKSAVNAVMQSLTWFDNNTLLYFIATKPVTTAPTKPLMPKGPAVQENYGKASPRPTYQDLIKTPFDEQLFEFFATSQLVKNTNGVETKIGQPAIYKSLSVSPDKKFLLIGKIKKPFSYTVPAFGFPSVMMITDLNGKLVKELATLPSSETSPGGYDNVQNVARSFDWRDDEPATITWCMPLDSGLIKKEVEYHDAIYAQSAPFTGQPKLLFKTKMRYFGTTWGNEQLAIVSEGLRSKQLMQLDRFNSVTEDLEALITRNTTDAYGSPGSPVTAPNKYGKNVLVITDNNSKILFNNTTGSSPKGDLPFLTSYNVHTKQTETIWRCNEGWYEMIVKVLDPVKLSVITRKESENEVPNYWLKNFRLRIADRKLTDFSNPYPQLEGVAKEKIKYKRADGVDLTGDLYLPKGYNKDRDGKLPVFIWAYPREFNSAADAAQVRGSEHRFTLINWGSPIFYVTQGYAVLNNAEMPIVATASDKKPNDDFVEQLTLNAEAAINVLDSLGVGDRNRVAVGGHSYGAFMTANLLAHTNLFKAGIARSGAYNRSLTPFGFQNEDRTYWQAQQLYTEMSPFTYADKIKTPLLLVHGDMDNNTGTYPIQSERMFSAIKGHGGTVKYISLPYESHGYQGKENILHMLNEQFQWLEKYVKNAPAAKKEGKKSF